MSLTFGLQGPRDLFEKLKRDAALLEEEVTSDRFFNFVVTGYSIVDCLRHEVSVPLTATEATYKDRWIKICGDLAIVSKHFQIKKEKRNPITTDATSRRGWGMGRYGKGGWGVGEESIEIELNDGSCLSALEFVKTVIETWDNFFTTHGL